MLILLILFSQSTLSADFAVIVSATSGIDVLSSERIRDIFLKKRRFAQGKRLVPVNLLGSKPPRLAFERRILEMDRLNLQQYWTASHFKGVTPPATQASLASVKLFIEKVDGAIGYLPIEMVDDRVKVIYEF
ncbi:MAG: hypothetical protein HOC70_04005 [Gammaproteobacteria bacterium]|nr:hypothetical protein [Gammaproteobacteria bacterium]MBT4492384.1 hypothetical protein [Gammaproteobacteria bacterium]